MADGASEMSAETKCRTHQFYSARHVDTCCGFHLWEILADGGSKLSAGTEAGHALSVISMFDVTEIKQGEVGDGCAGGRTQTASVTTAPLI